MANLKQSAGGCVTSGSVTESGSDGRRAATASTCLAKAPAPLPLRAGHLFIPELIDLYMQHYAGRDGSRVQRLTWWSNQLKGVRLSEVSDDHVHEALAALSQEPCKYYAGRDASDHPIYRSKHRSLAPATLNRYAAALGAVVTWALKKRIAPKGFAHPCRTLERQEENNEKTRFLSPEERGRLLEACRASRWRKLHALVLLALTTGARRGELLSLRWQDIDFDSNLAHCGRTKNGDPKTLPLVPAVAAELGRLKGSNGALVFASDRSPGKAFSFEGCWERALKQAKLRNFRFHDLRHTCASMLAQNGATLLEIGDVLGHRQLQVTKRYSHLTVSHKAALINRVLGNLDDEGR